MSGQRPFKFLKKWKFFTKLLTYRILSEDTRKGSNFLLSTFNYGNIGDPPNIGVWSALVRGEDKPERTSFWCSSLTSFGEINTSSITHLAVRAICNFSFFRHGIYESYKWVSKLVREAYEEPQRTTVMNIWNASLSIHGFPLSICKLLSLPINFGLSILFMFRLFFYTVQFVSWPTWFTYMQI